MRLLGEREWTAIAIWVIVGAALGVGLTPLCRHLLIRQDRRSSPVLIGLVTAMVFGLLAWRVSSWADLLAYSVFATFGVAVSMIDIAEHRIPTMLVLPAYPVIIGLFGTVALLHHELVGIVRSALGLLVLPAFYLILALASQGGVGAGDIRLAGPVGWVMAWHGWTTLLIGTLLTFIVASLSGLTMIIWRSATRTTPIPFAPAIIAGALAMIVLRGA